MAKNYNLNGLLSGPKFSTACEVQLKVEICDFEDLNKVAPDFKHGIKIQGELSYLDSVPPTFAVTTGMAAKLTLKHPTDNTLGETKCNIVLFNTQASTDIGKQRMYFWQFLPLEIITDNLEIIPKEYSFSNIEKTINKVFLCQDFRGSWPYPVCAVISAPNKYEARKVLAQQLQQMKIPFVSHEGFTLVEVDCNNNYAYVIQDGE
jgi:hypothetical protein